MNRSAGCSGRATNQRTSITTVRRRDVDRVDLYQDKPGCHDLEGKTQVGEAR